MPLPSSSAPRPGRRSTLAALLGAATLPFVPPPATAACPPASWPLWQRFVARYLQEDGRIADHSVTELHSTSESQSYGMFFALAANDPGRFDRIWQWSVNNLAAGDAAATLPAWQWGKRPDGNWGVLDANPASDADLWFAYALLEAGRLWHEPRYQTQGRALMALIAAQEVVELPGLGPMLLPSKAGFALPDRLWRLNPSYLPVPLLRRLATEDPRGPWNAIAANTARMLTEVAPRGFVPDWTAYKSPDGSQGYFIIDPLKADKGSYDAIRAYMWAGMTPLADPLASGILKAVGGMKEAAATGIPPETTHAASGHAYGTGPAGFSAALLPYFKAMGMNALYKRHLARATAELLERPLEQTRYYDYVLGLFGMGWSEQYYRFSRDGRLQLHWEARASCR